MYVTLDAMEGLTLKITSSKVLSRISEIEKERAAAGIIPTHATVRELARGLGMPIKEVRGALDYLKSRGYVITGDTINDTYARFPTENE